MLLLLLITSEITKPNTLIIVDNVYLYIDVGDILLSCILVPFLFTYVSVVLEMYFGCKMKII